eukprot:5042107-Pleurochrysis_carterae.AAC.3
MGRRWSRTLASRKREEGEDGRGRRRAFGRAGKSGSEKPGQGWGKSKRRKADTRETKIERKLAILQPDRSDA